MSEPVTLTQLFNLYRHELGFSLIAALVAVMREWQQRHPFREIVTNGVICAAFAFGANTVLEVFGISGGKWGYLASVLLGYMGIETMLSVVSDKIPFLKKTRNTGGSQ